MIAVANKKEWNALGVISVFDISIRFISYRILNVIITDRVETKAPIPFKLTLAIIPLVYTGLSLLYLV